MFTISISTFFFFVTFLRLSKSSPITPVTQPCSSPPRMPMDLCPDFVPGTKGRKASKCLPHQEIALQGLPYGHLPTADDASADPCHWNFQCRTDAARTSTASTSGQKDAFWWEAVLKTPGKNGPRICQTGQGQGRCVPLKKHEIVVRYPRNSSEKACFCWRKVKVSYYCNWTVSRKT